MAFPECARGVTVTEVHIMSASSGRSDYVLQGESVQLSCHYVLAQPNERVIVVSWKKDGREVSHALSHPH